LRPVRFDSSEAAFNKIAHKMGNDSGVGFTRIAICARFISPYQERTDLAGHMWDCEQKGKEVGNRRYCNAS